MTTMLPERSVIAAGVYADGVGWIAADSLTTLHRARPELFPVEEWVQMTVRSESGPLRYVAEYRRRGFRSRG